MAFTDYKHIDEVVAEFQLSHQSIKDLFPRIEPMQPGPALAFFLEHMAERALIQKSEKARSEWIISPFLAEMSVRAHAPTMVYSGISFRMTAKLAGFPDFMVGRGNDPIILSHPLLAMVEAKDEKFNEGGGACAAQMIAARDFNAANGHDGPVFGCVTNGAEWSFFRLVGHQLTSQRIPIFYLPPERLLGVLVAIASGTA